MLILYFFHTNKRLAVIKIALTPKQEKFCQCVVSGMSYKDSYLTAYNWNGSEKGAQTQANEIALREDIQKRIAELQKPVIRAIQSDNLNEYDRIKTLCWERINECQANGDDTAIARYMDILNKMSGTYININRNIEDKQADIVNLDSNTLERLAGIS